MEDVATSELLRQRHFIKAYDAGGVNTYSSCLILEIDVWEAFQLVHKRPWLDEKLHWFVQLDQRVDALAEEVQRKLTANKDPKEELGIENQDKWIEDESRNIEHKAFLYPLFPIVQLNRRQLILEVVLDTLEK